MVHQRQSIYLFIQRNKILLATLLGSLLLHGALFLPSQKQAPIIPDSQKVIHAKLTSEHAQYPLLSQEPSIVAKAENAESSTSTTEAVSQPPTPTVQATQSVIKQPLSKPKTHPVQKATQKPIPTNNQVAAESAASTPLAKAGLAIQQDTEASDPIQQRYEQLLLAHLRNKTTAPSNLNGQVRLSIKFSYRQIATEVKIIQSSGDEAVDRWAVRSVLAANPFPSIPTELPDNFTFRPTLKIAP